MVIANMVIGNMVIGNMVIANMVIGNMVIGNMFLCFVEFLEGPRPESMIDVFFVCVQFNFLERTFFI